MEWKRVLLQEMSIHLVLPGIKAGKTETLVRKRDTKSRLVSGADTKEWQETVVLTVYSTYEKISLARLSRRGGRQELTGFGKEGAGVHSGAAACFLRDVVVGFMLARQAVELLKKSIVPEPLLLLDSSDRVNLKFCLEPSLCLGSSPALQAASSPPRTSSACH